MPPGILVLHAEFFSVNLKFFQYRKTDFQFYVLCVCKEQTGSAAVNIMLE
jgi:hypothetical protein